MKYNLGNIHKIKIKGVTSVPKNEYFMGLFYDDNQKCPFVGKNSTIM